MKSESVLTCSPSTKPSSESGTSFLPLKMWCQTSMDAKSYVKLILIKDTTRSQSTLIRDNSRHSPPMLGYFATSGLTLVSRVLRKSSKRNWVTPSMVFHMLKTSAMTSMLVAQTRTLMTTIWNRYSIDSMRMDWQSTYPSVSSEFPLCCSLAMYPPKRVCRLIRRRLRLYKMLLHQPMPLKYEAFLPLLHSALGSLRILH